MFVKAKEKLYPDGTKKIYVYKVPFVVGRETEESNVFLNAENEKTEEEIKQEKINSEYMNLLRTKRTMQDYVLSNEFDRFWTLTFSTERENDSRAFSRLSDWLKYMKRKYGLFDYMFVPERHEDGCIHFHGVTGGFGGEFIEGKKDGKQIYHKGQKVYNCVNWRYGWSTVTLIRDKKKTASYITKYITKDLEENIVGKGKRKYWPSQGLRKPVETYFNHNPKEGHQPDWENDNVMIFNN